MIIGTRAFVSRSRWASLVGVFVGGTVLASPTFAQPCSPEEVAKLLAADGASDDDFGWSVSISGDVAVIGAHGNGDSGPLSGSAYVFRFDGANWMQDAKLLPNDGAALDYFGYSVSVSGDTAVVGAWGDEFSTGSAYVFRFDGSNWTQEAKLLADDGATVDDFGWSVSVSGDTAVIGAVGGNGNGTTFGSAYIFRFDGTNWTHEPKLVPSDVVSIDEFGRSVSVSGNAAVIGAWRDDDNGSSSGSAYIFDLNCTGVCLPDTNGDGMLTPTDFTAWINAFNNQLPECDQNGDGSCTPTDFTAWIANFNAGC